MGPVIHLLGTPSVLREGTVKAVLRGHKAWGLLAYLVQHPAGVSRQRLATLLFEDAEDPLAALRWNLSELRRALGDVGLGGDVVVLPLERTTYVDIDVVARGHWSRALQVPGLGQDLLDGMGFASSPSFEVWLEAERRRMRATAQSVLREAALARLAKGAAAEAAQLAARLVGLEPLDESFQVLLVRCLSTAGDGVGAARQAAACRELFIFGLEIDDQAEGVLAMWFFDAKKGIAYSAAGWLAETSDSGRTWTHRALTSPNYYGGPARLQFASATTGWLATSYKGTISKTTDGGASWWTPLGVVDFGYLRDFHFIDADLGWAVGANGTISSSHDGAQTWVTQTTLPYALNSVRFSSASVGVVVGSGGIIARTADGGAHWSLRASGVTSTLTRVVFIDASIGWAIGQNGAVTRTTDGGLSWSRVAVPSFASLNDVFFIDSQHGWIVGSGGAVLATDDGGESWHLQSSATDKNLNVAFFVDARTGWLAGDGGSILATATGGH